jgi:hypothetical protein
LIARARTSACGARRNMARKALPLLSKSCIAMHSVPCVKTGQIPAATVQRFATIPLRFSPATLRLQLLLVTRRTGTPKTTRCKKNFMKKIAAEVQGGCHGVDVGWDVGWDSGRAR